MNDELDKTHDSSARLQRPSSSEEATAPLPSHPEPTAPLPQAAPPPVLGPPPAHAFPTSALDPRTVPPPPGVPPIVKGLVLGLLGLVVGGGLVVAAVRGKAALPTVAPRPVAVATIPPPSTEALDAAYVAWREPIPPAECRRPSEAARLAKVSSDRQALALVENPGPEAAYLLARATYTETKTRHPALDVALGCHGFAAAEHLAANLALAADDRALAAKHLKAAVAAAPGFLDARVKLAGLLAQQGQLDEAMLEIDAVTSADASFAAAWLIRSGIEGKQGKKPESEAHLCKAAGLGSSQARDLAGQLGLTCPPAAPGP